MTLVATKSASDSTSAATELKRVEDLWYRDGTIVLCTTARYAFRVYQGILENHSEFFKDVFSAGKPHSEQTVDGCPSITLHDKPMEVEHFLRSIFVQRYFVPSPSMIDLPIALSVLRLAHKYQCDQLRRMALSQVSICFPTTLEAFNSKEIPPLRLCLRAVEIIREIGELWLLPSALYSLLQVLPENVLANPKNYPSSINLSPETRTACLHFKFRLPMLRNLLTEFLFIDCPGCTKPNTCNALRLSQLKKLAWDLEAHRDHELFGFWVAISAKYLSRVCKECNARAKRVYKDKRRTVWELLPGVFGMKETWKDLERLKERALRNLT